MNQDFLTLLGIVIAGVVAVGSQPGRFTLWETSIGIILFALLCCINPTGFHWCCQKFAFCAIAGFCWTIIFGFPIEKCLDRRRCFDVPPGQKESEKRHCFFFGLWILFSLIAFFVFFILHL